MKSYIDAAADFDAYEVSKVVLKESFISARRIELAVPEGTTAAQWQQLQNALSYGAS